MGFNGILDEIKIWREALSEDDLKLAMEGKINIAVSSKSALTTTWGSVKN